MTHYPRNSTSGRECSADQETPADQPTPPSDCGSCDLKPTEPPDLKKPEECKSPEDPCCKCPSTAASLHPCLQSLEDLIAKQADDIRAAAKAEAFKKELEGLLKMAKEASLKYTREKYEEHRDEWVRQDAAIADLLRKLVCDVKCWRCIIDCHVCPLLNELHYAEKRLHDDGKLYTEVHDLYDLQHWWTRYAAAKKREFDRITAILKVWGNPADIIGKALSTNRGLYDSARKVLGTEPGKAIFDVFLLLVPTHLAIAPPQGTKWVTQIDKEFTQFCTCSKGKPDYCCGVDVGEWSLRQRLIGPQPYLIDPSQYLGLLCCLVDKRWRPAKKIWDDAEIGLEAVKDRIVRNEAQFKDWIKTFSDNAKAEIPSVPECCDYTRHAQDAEQPPKPRAY